MSLLHVPRRRVAESKRRQYMPTWQSAEPRGRVHIAAAAVSLIAAARAEAAAHVISTNGEARCLLSPMLIARLQDIGRDRASGHQHQLKPYF